jgi:glutamate decarboxylase
VATYISTEVAAMGPFELLSKGDQLPVFAFTTNDSAQGWDVFAASFALRERGWQVPAYTFPADREDLAVLRVVCRNGFSQDLADVFLNDLRDVVKHLSDNRGQVKTTRSGFHH